MPLLENQVPNDRRLLGIPIDGNPQNGESLRFNGKTFNWDIGIGQKSKFVLYNTSIIVKPVQELFIFPFSCKSVEQTRTAYNDGIGQLRIPFPMKLIEVNMDVVQNDWVSSPVDYTGYLNLGKNNALFGQFPIPLGTGIKNYPYDVDLTKGDVWELAVIPTQSSGAANDFGFIFSAVFEVI